MSEARELAGRAGDDYDGGWHQLSFGPGNTGIHAVAAAIELGDGPTVLSQAETCT
jgi:hypothetical protein